MCHHRRSLLVLSVAAFVLLFLPVGAGATGTQRHWSRTFHPPGIYGRFSFAKVAAAPTGDIYNAGVFGDRAADTRMGAQASDLVARGAKATDLGVGDLYLVKYDTKGYRKWWRKVSVGTGRSFILQDMATDSTGAVVLVGMDTDRGTTVRGISVDAKWIVTKYARDGSRLWTKRLQGNDAGLNGNAATGLTVLSDDSIVVTGVLRNATTMSDWYTVKYSPSGATLWTRVIGGGGSDTLNQTGSGVTSRNDVIYAVGRNQLASTETMRVVSYSSAGMLRWDSEVAGDGFLFATPRAISVSSAGVAIAGEVYVGVEFATWHAAAAGLTLAGDETWDYVEPTQDSYFYSRFNSVSINAGGQVVAGGDINGIQQSSSTYWVKRFTPAGDDDGSFFYPADTFRAGTCADVKELDSGKIYSTGTTTSLAGPWKGVTLCSATDLSQLWGFEWGDGTNQQHFGEYTDLQYTSKAVWVAGESDRILKLANFTP